MWARQANEVTLQLPALAGEALLVSATGEEQTLRAVNGFYRVRLGGARCAPACDIGGPPVLVVESVGEEAAMAVPTIDAAAVVLATATATMTPNATATTLALSATPTTTPTTTPTPSATPTASPTPSITPSPPATDTPQPTATAAPPTHTPPATEVVALAPTATADSTVAAATPPIASWLFIGAAVVLAGVLGMAVYRRRS